jgi:hypothetical protein
VLLCSDGLHGMVGEPALAILMSAPHAVDEAVRLMISAARVAGGSDNITAIVAELGGDRLVAPTGDEDLPTFREFDPQKEGDPALTSTSYVARRLAARIGLPTSTPPMLPVTGQHAIMHSRIGMRVPATVFPVDEVEGPARRRLRASDVPWWWFVAIAIVGCAIAWVLGAR